MSPKLFSTRQRQRASAHRSSSRSTPDAITSRLFPRRSPQRSSANANVGGLKPSPAGRLRRARQPPSLRTAPQPARRTQSRSPTHLPRSCSQHHDSLQLTQLTAVWDLACTAIPEGLPPSLAQRDDSTILASTAEPLNHLRDTRVSWYNNERLHSWCGHRPPLEFEQD